MDLVQNHKNKLSTIYQKGVTEQTISKTQLDKMSALAHQLKTLLQDYQQAHPNDRNISVSNMIARADTLQENLSDFWHQSIDGYQDTRMAEQYLAYQNMRRQKDQGKIIIE